MYEIEKMFENAGVKPINIAEYGSTYIPEKIEINGKPYPPFTAEKQLKILCFIVNNKHSVTFHDRVFGYDKLTLEKTQENLAWAINRIWQDLTEGERKQIKEVLK